ncbi:MAG: hypothetical protein M3347_15120 [Armatimonadota bacterium]|nr:hypothetical protein [Armatimonadota bacterium]
MSIAQVGNAEISTVKVRYSRLLPVAIRKQMPRGGKSRFFGISQLKFNRQNILLHVYDTKKTDFSSNRASYGVKDYAPSEREFQAGPLKVSVAGSGYGVQQVGLDLFVRNIKADGKFQKINSVRFNYVRFVNAAYPSHETVGVDVIWLDPKTKRIPIFKIDLRDPNGVLGAVGVNMLVVFPNGLRGKAVVEGFGYGADNSTYSNVWYSQFNTLDSRGLLQVNSVHSKASIGKSIKTVLEWNGKYFMPTHFETVINSP